MLLLRSTNLANPIKISSVITLLNKSITNKAQCKSLCHYPSLLSFTLMSRACIRHPICFSFSTQSPEKTSLYMIKMACEELLDLSSLLLDDLCLAFGKTYILAEKLKDEAKAQKNEEEVMMSLKQELTKYKYDADCKQLLKHIKLIYQFLNGSKVGFLRGDLHSRTFFQLNKDISEKITAIESTQRRQEIQYRQEDFLKLLNSVTDPTFFRIPHKGIYKRQLQSRVNLYHRQVLLEEISSTQSHDKLEEIFQSLMKLNKVQEAQVVRKFIIDWLVPLTGALKEEQSRCSVKELTGSRKHYGQFLLKIDAQKLATVALTQLIIETFEAVCKIGSIQEFHIQDYEGILQEKYIKEVIKKIEAQIAYERQEKIFRQNQREYDQFIKKESKNRKKEKDDGTNMDIQAELPEDDAEGTERFRFWKTEAFKQKEKELQYKYVKPLLRKEFLRNMITRITRFKKYTSNFTQKSQTELGHLIVYLLKELLKIQNKYGYKVPLLISEHKSVQKNNNFYSVSILRLNQHFLLTLIPKLQKSQDMFVHMQRSVPTIIQPLPWLEPEIGGYYSQATNVMRFSNCPIQQRLIKYADNHRVFGVLNSLSKVPWKINKDVLNIVQEIWSEGGMQNYIPKRYSELLNPYITKYKLQTDFKKKRELAKIIQNLRDQHSLRSDFLLKLNIAQTFSKLDYFYFPHNLDFRGRVYPIPPHLNHIGNDLARGLLLFGKGQRLGESGVKWLKIHTANLMGKDKASIGDKLIFIDQNVDLIHKFADNPLGNREWLQFEDCWQAIGSIIDLSRALRSPNPQDYISHMHVHQDGSCNGLQHYAALGRDIEGAYQVNLGPGEKPSDIYTHVSKMVIKMINEDLQREDTDKQIHEFTKKLPDNIKRKTIKQTVMTSVYGVTFIGARQQIYKQLRDQDFLSEEETYQASLYIAKLTLKAISNLFIGAHEIKKWFRTCANIVSKTGNPVGWISPLGLPIVQPYRKQSKIDIIKIVSHRMQVPKEIENIPINIAKQTSAFPPNFVHSLDSSHMMYTAEVCNTRKLTFAAVHDSYWTHAGTVEQMNSILRQQFVKLHSQPLLQNFRKSLLNRFPELQFPDIPQRGQFDLQKIKYIREFYYVDHLLFGCQRKNGISGLLCIYWQFHNYCNGCINCLKKVLKRTKMSKMFGQYVTAYHTFYTFIKDGLLFLVLVESAYEARIAVSFLKKIQQSFFARFDSKIREKAVAYELEEFSPILQDWMRKYSNKSEVDKLYNLKKELDELQQQSLKNMDMIIERGEKIENLVAKSQTLAHLSHDVAVTARTVKNKIWWKNKKVLIGIVLTFLIVIAVVVLIVLI